MKKYAEVALITLSFLSAALLFYVDLLLPLGIPVAVLYIIPLMIASAAYSYAHIPMMAAVTTMLTFIGYLLSPPEVSSEIAAVNRLISLAAIWVVAVQLLRWKYLKQGLRDLVRLKTRDLKEAQDNLSSVLRSIPDGLLLIDSRGRIKFANDQISDVLGCSAQELLDNKSVDFFPSDVREAVQAHFNACLGGIRYRRLKEPDYIPLLRCDGSKTYGEISLSSVRCKGEPIILMAIRDVHDRKLKEEEEEIYQRELRHRMSNTISLVMSLIKLSSVREKSVESFANGLEKRVAAFSRMQDLFRGQKEVSRINLRKLIRDITEPYDYQNMSRVNIHAPTCDLGKQLAQRLYLVFFELATNAAKYGAFSTAEGRLEVSCHLNDWIKIDWKEFNVSFSVAPPPASDKQCFGWQLIETVIKEQLKGEISRSFEEDGLRVKIAIPEDRTQFFRHSEETECGDEERLPH